METNSQRNDNNINNHQQQHYLHLLKTVINGDWETAKSIFDSDPSALTARLSEWQETTLHVAVNTGRFLHFVRNLVDLLPETSVRLTDGYGGSALHNAAIAGNTEAARILVAKAPSLLHLKNNNFGDAPIHSAARYGHRETFEYLLSVTKEDVDPSPFAGQDGAKLLNLLVVGDFYGLAVEVLRRFPSLAREHDSFGRTAISTLAEKPLAFPSGTRIGHCQRFWRHCISLLGKTTCSARSSSSDDVEKNRGETKLELTKHRRAMELLRLLISGVLKAETTAEFDRLLAPPIVFAAALGIYEIVTEIVKAYPNAIWLADPNGMYIFHLAVINRQEKVFNILYQMSANRNFATALRVRDSGDNLLHLAGKLGDTERIPGAALKVQRELQWFNEVEKMVQPSYREMKNYSWKTPRNLFTEEHKSLIEQGEKWMKDTALSCSVVAALVVTVVFAAAFTLPGGANDKGVPIYINNGPFIVFVAADILALFSGSTSLLMFLGIMTARYSERDFLRSLPMKMGIGLFALFLSIAAMMTAFGASLHIILYHKVRWILAPIGLVASVPSILFAFLQFPLLAEVVLSTFGPSIFGKQSDEIIA
ncbi:unnamed protein product [Linum tenue]|uniref:PGG domain-containing protein n=3 Tax=Linum tenue TaxID=586396 RepID=A0AAV0I3D9_9ROSI|nr:unnamed protein product [Linum tenue]